MTVPAVVNPALGTQIAHGAGSPVVYTAIAQVASIDGPESETGTRETTNLSSTSKTYAKTLFDGGEFSVELQFDPKSDTHATLMTLFYGKSQAVDGELWQLTFADVTNGPSTAKFKAIITKLGPSGIEPESNLMANMSLKISGDVVWT